MASLFRKTTDLNDRVSYKKHPRSAWSSLPEPENPTGFDDFFKPEPEKKPVHLVFFKPGYTRTRNSNPRVPELHDMVNKSLILWPNGCDIVKKNFSKIRLANLSLLLAI